MNKNSVFLTILGVGFMALVSFFWGMRNSQQLQTADHASIDGGKAAAKKAPPLVVPKPPKVAAEKANASTAKYSMAYNTINEFAILSQKAVKTETEKLQFKELFSKENLVDAKNFLTSPEGQVTSEVSLHHQKAVQFVIDGLRQNPRDSLAVAYDIVADKTVEDQNLDSTSRQLLAKDKAEVMFHLFALAPSTQGKLEKSENGPVTQKILSNVLAQHRQNKAESDKEVAQYKSGRW